MNKDTRFILLTLVFILILALGTYVIVTSA